MKIKVSAVLDIDENVYGTEESEMEWFKEMIADKENTMLILHSNDIGDTIGETFYFDWEILNDEAQLPQQEISKDAKITSFDEISDEEIWEASINYDNGAFSETPMVHFQQGAFWYREQLKQRQ